MKKRLFIVLMGLVAPMVLRATDTFEAPAFALGETVAGKSGWQGSATVSDEQSSEGSQALKVGGEQSAQREIGITSWIQFYDFYILPSWSAKATPVIKAGGAWVAFQKATGGGKVVAIFEGQPVATARPTYAVEADDSSEKWIRVTVRADRASEKWDLFLDGRPVLVEERLNAGAGFEFAGTSEAASYLDELEIAEDNPLFRDTDKDGMPDAEEMANGLDPFHDDRLGDLDGDGVSNIREMLAGTSPSQAGSGTTAGAGTLIFVDNLVGNDANTGEQSYPSIGTSGPKASIKAAMEAAPSGAKIVVLKGSGVYDEGSRGVAGKSLTIKTVEPVTIR